MRIATGAIKHETNTFSNVTTDLDKFRNYTLGSGILQGEDIPRTFVGTRTEQGGFWDVAKEEGIDLIPALWAAATPSGLIAQAAFEHLRDTLVDHVRAAGPLDGVLLDLHGAMVAEDCEDGDGAVLSALRDAIGKNIPIICTLDLHANITGLMVEKADALIGYDTYPHIDAYERGVEAARLLAGTLRGQIRPAMAMAKLPLLTAPPAQRTNRHPMKRLIDRAHELERESDVCSVTVAAGFPFADITEAGFGAVVINSDGNRDSAGRRATELAEMAWSMRHAFVPETVSVGEAVERAVRAAGGPVVLADTSDNPGGGAPGDGTAILAGLLQADARGAVVAAIADPEAVREAIAVGVGRSGTLRIGGKTDQLHGATLTLDCKVRLLSDGRFIQTGPFMTGARMDMGLTAVVECGGIEIILTEKRLQATSLSMLRSLGIEPLERQTLALKSAVHYRAAFEPIAAQVIEVDGPGIHSARLASFDYRRVRRPIFPLDDIPSHPIDWLRMG